MSCSDTSPKMLARYCSGRRFGSLNTLVSTTSAGPFAGGGPLTRSFEEAYWFGRDGTEGTGGALPSKSVGRALNLEEYRRLTRSDVYKSLVKNSGSKCLWCIPFLQLEASEEALRKKTSHRYFLGRLFRSVGWDQISVSER